MLIYHFKAETQGFQGLGDQNHCGKAKVPKKSHFLKDFFEGSQGGEFGRIKATSIPSHIINENILVFDIADGQPKPTSFS